MTTQTLQDATRLGRLHWRADRANLAAFAPAFAGLLGDDAPASAAEMREFAAFIAGIHYPPNPYRTLTNGLPTAIDLSDRHYVPVLFSPPGVLPQRLGVGNPQVGRSDFFNAPLDGNLTCSACHLPQAGVGANAPQRSGDPDHASVSVDGNTNATMKIPQLRNMEEKVGFQLRTPVSRKGFGFTHDGDLDSLENFLTEPVFNFANTQQVADMVAFMLAFSGSDLPPHPSLGEIQSLDTHAAVGAQVTLAGPPTTSQRSFLSTVTSEADRGRVGLIAKGVFSRQRGYTYKGSNVFQSDRALEKPTLEQLLAQARPGQEITFTVVPEGTQARMGTDRDGDGCLDGDDDQPTDPTRRPANCPLP